jgi:glycerate-2-kinase
MAVRIIGIAPKKTPQPSDSVVAHLSIENFKWINEQSLQSGVSSLSTMFDWIVNKKGQAYVKKGDKIISVFGAYSPVGKCATDAAFVLEEILGDRIYKGMVIDIKCDPRLKRIKSAECDHPFPSERNVDATKEMIDVLKEAKEDDVVIAVISGGGSTMLCQPKGFTCYDEKTVVDALFRAGANIKELNTVRKHMSMARGGHLAGYAYPAKVVSLIFSDVVGNDLGFIASGPTVLDETSVEDAKHEAEHREHLLLSPEKLLDLEKEF